MNPLADVCLRYLDGDLTESEVKDFDRLIAESPVAARELARHLIDEHYFTKTLATQADPHIDADDSSDASALNRAVRHLERQEESEHVLRELLRQEREATPLPRTDEALPTKEGAGRNTSNSVTWEQASGASIYLLSHAAKSRAAKWLAAAAVLLAATLLIAFITQTNNDASSDPALTQGSTDDIAQPATQAVVATLTAENNAQWASDSGAVRPAVGDGLSAGQSLTLLRGTAQLTTAHGSIAILSAPCTLELLKGGNALRLVHGQIVGICETESSKGFLVRTPHMDVTDLGTRFGVDVSKARETQVHVFEGEVKVALPGTQAAGVERVLSAGEALAARGDSRTLAAVPADSERFSARHELATRPGLAHIEGVREIAGDLQPGSASLFIGKDDKQWPTSRDAFLFEEFSGQSASPFMVNLVESGTYNQLPKTPETPIPAATALRSYILIKTRNPDLATVEVHGSVTFENEVIGIITEQSTADVFARAANTPARVFAPSTKTEHWVDFKIEQDRVTLSEDRRTITFAFKNKDSADTIRVLVRAEQADSQP